MEFMIIMNRMNQSVIRPIVLKTMCQSSVTVSFSKLNIELMMTMAKIQEVLPIYEKLKNEWNRKPPNVKKTSELIHLLKVYFEL